MAKILDPRFQEFAGKYKDIFEKKDIHTKIGVYIFLEKVSEKFQRDSRRAEALEPSQQLKQRPADSVVKAFLNADENIRII
ncbi:hypothetical protein [Candidatus Odyssella thessalonicensis]|uniref:hypothetical protein n=1 Tax=Candidatus Odyssella thessalonicensis TaxID=84647 RepID=UPI000225A9AC|nr:hypothetical protein [Candidatus Odyssella thessalonicensis]